ncbi:MAG: hypothetical protein J0I29_07470, partial [Rhizobiales bacterium]|nr:hypothetical protein [Hyphomicrobiales bacterium]
MRFVRSAVVCAALLAISHPAFAEEALTSGGWLSGTLRLVHTKYPNGTKVEAYQIVSEPRQMQASDDFCTNPGPSIVYGLLVFLLSAAIVYGL